MTADVNYVPLDLTSGGLQSEAVDRVSMLESCVPSAQSLNMSIPSQTYSDILVSGPENSTGSLANNSADTLGLREKSECVNVVFENHISLQKTCVYQQLN